MNSLNLILDGNNIIFRAYHVTKTKQIVEGVNINVVNQFMRMIKGYTERFSPSDVYIVWDKRLNPDGDNFRKDLTDYKGNRDVDTDTLDEIFGAVDVITELSKTLGIKHLYPWALEADDVIAYLCDELGDSIVVSGDKDLLQLVDERVRVYNTTKNEMVSLDNFETFTAVPKDRFVDYKAILGDKSDNIEGLVGYGEVKSKRIAISQSWDALDKDQLEILQRNRKLMDLTKSYENSEGEVECYKEQIDNLADTNISKEDFEAMCRKYELHLILRDFNAWNSLLSMKNLLEEWFSFD